MFRSLLPEIQNIGSLQVVSLLIFVSIFAAVLYLAFTMGRQHIQHMKHLPLDLEDDGSIKHGESSHG